MNKRFTYGIVAVVVIAFVAGAWWYFESVNLRHSNPESPTPQNSSISANMNFFVSLQPGDSSEQNSVTGSLPSDGLLPIYFTGPDVRNFGTGSIDWGDGSSAYNFYPAPQGTCPARGVEADGCYSNVVQAGHNYQSLGTFTARLLDASGDTVATATVVVTH
ncbi:hypothetical protein GW831_00510 [Candidatus Wolfebacteria bacterium]|nr:hypothetical protein [Candidatus Wolfebacteria bacterium]